MEELCWAASTGSKRLHMIASHVVNTNTHMEEDDFDCDTDLGLSPGHMRDLILWEFYISVSIYEYVIIVRILKVHEGHYG